LVEIAGSNCTVSVETVDAIGELWLMNGQFDVKKPVLSVDLACREGSHIDDVYKISASQHFFFHFKSFLSWSTYQTEIGF